MAGNNKRVLVQAAAKARQRAVAPYSRFKVGAALLTRSGEVITGANVESASYGLTCCAERVALFKALTERQEGLRGRSGRGSRTGRADALRRLPPASRRVCPERHGLGGGQPRPAHG